MTGPDEERDAIGRTATASAADAASTVLAYLLSGPLTFGAIGYGVDHLLGTAYLVGVGILTGLALSLYIIWLRYGGS